MANSDRLLDSYYNELDQDAGMLVTEYTLAVSPDPERKASYVFTGDGRETMVKAFGLMAKATGWMAAATTQSGVAVSGAGATAEAAKAKMLERVKAQIEREKKARQ